MKLWEKTLDNLHRQGWSYGYAGFVHLETGKHFWVVDAFRGSTRIHGKGETMSLAVDSLVDQRNKIIGHLGKY